MPHSSGGGSHGGGSHSSHSSSSSRSHSSGGGSHSGGVRQRPIVVTTPTRGYSHYAFYRNGGIRYEYIKDSPDTTWWGLIVSLLFLLPYAFFGAIALFSGVEVVEPLQTSKYEIVIEDDLDVLTDAEEANLERTFVKFQDKTGITCALVTTSNEDWQQDYNNLEAFAYDKYVNTWYDEDHWLFVYSQPDYVAAGEFVDWYWEGMQGDNTDALLPTSVTNSFNEDVQKYLTMGKYSVGDAFDMSVKDLTENIKVSGLRFEPGAFVFSIIWFGVLIVIFLQIVSRTICARIREKRAIIKRRGDGIKVPDVPLEDTCEYCGGVYIHGIHLNCPHCSAPIKPLRLSE